MLQNPEGPWYRSSTKPGAQNKDVRASVRLKYIPNSYMDPLETGLLMQLRFFVCFGAAGAGHT